MTDQCILYPTGDNFYTTIKDYCVSLDIYVICCSFLNVPSGFRNVNIFSSILCNSFTDIFKCKPYLRYLGQFQSKGLMHRKN